MSTETRVCCITIDGQDYLIEAVDETHYKLAAIYDDGKRNNFGWPLHVGQSLSKELGDDIYKWLGTGKALKSRYETPEYRMERSTHE